LYTHNFYGDILLSIRTLFDNHIFQNRNYAKRYEFNMGNRAIQLPIDYKPNFEFPNLIVTLNDEVSSFGQRPDVSQKIPGFNLDQTPVLYNQTTEVTLLLQEELVNVPISIVINCESQFQAKEIAIMIKRWLPINKFISFLSLTSYLEVSAEFLSKIEFDPSVHLISNLYTKMNKRTGDIDYCYSIEYKPMIRLDSISTSIPDSTQRSFQVNVEIAYMIQMPLYMFSNALSKAVERVDFVINPTSGFEPINDSSPSRIANGLSSDLADLKLGYVRRTCLVSEDSSARTDVSLDTVDLASDQVTTSSLGGNNIVVTRSSDEQLIVTVGNSESQYRTDISSISDTTIPLSTDQYLLIEKDFAGTITTTLKTIKENLTVKFSPLDFLITASYSYNLIKGENILKDYKNYILDLSENSVTFIFDESQYSTYAPSITSPLLVQFYLKESTFPIQIGGIAPKVGLMKVFNITSTAAEMTWTSDEMTTTRIEYGTTSSYGALSALKSNYTNTHKVVLTGLGPNTTYHYRVKVENLEGEEYLSDDYTFTTLT